MRHQTKITAFALAALALATGTAFAAGVRVVNNSGLPIDELSVSAPGANQWGANLLEGTKEGVLDSGKTYLVKDLKDGVYDFQLSAPDEAIFCTMPNVQVKNGVARLTAAMAAPCQ